MTSSLKERVSVRGFTGIRGNPTFSWRVELVASIVFAILDCSVWQCARKCGRLHVDTTSLVAYSIACCLAVYFTTRGLIADWLLWLVIIRKLQLLWYRLLIFALGFSTVDCANTCAFDDLGHYLTIRYSSISPLSFTS